MVPRFETVFFTEHHLPCGANTHKPPIQLESANVAQREVIGIRSVIAEEKTDEEYSNNKLIRDNCSKCFSCLLIQQLVGCSCNFSEEWSRQGL